MSFSTSSGSTSSITHQLGKALSPYIQHQASNLFIYGNQGYGIYILCVQTFAPDGRLVATDYLHGKRQDLGEHPRTTACAALSHFLGPYLPFATKSAVLHGPMISFWDGSTGTTSYCVHGSALDERLLAEAIHTYNSGHGMHASRQLTWVRMNHLGDTLPPDVVAYLRSQRLSRWDH